MNLRKERKLIDFHFYLTTSITHVGACNFNRFNSWLWTTETHRPYIITSGKNFLPDCSFKIGLKLRVFLVLNFTLFRSVFLTLRWFSIYFSFNHYIMNILWSVAKIHLAGAEAWKIHREQSTFNILNSAKRRFHQLWKYQDFSVSHIFLNFEHKNNMPAVLL